MRTRTEQTGAGSGNQRQRSRLRGMFTGRTGKTIGFTSIAAPIIGYVVNDLRKPDSIVRRLVGGAVRKLLATRTDKVEVIDITSEVEIIEDKSDTKG